MFQPRPRLKASLRRLVRAAPWLVVTLLAGCHIVPRTRNEPSKSDWEHPNLYNHRAPYPKLLVEIDAVEGQGPTRAELKDLEAFLRNFCDKPGGITIKVDNVIPKRTAAGRSAESLALEYQNGPPDDQSAFLYMLFYNTRLHAKDAFTDNPSFSPLPLPIVWIDRSYHFLGNPWRGTFRRAILLHEAGHALGLCATTNPHGKEGHCTNANCRMYPAINFDLWRFFTLRNPWTNTTLCPDCVAELAQNKAQPPAAKFDFWHGYFRRREEGYQVLGAPGLVYVHFGEAPEAPSDELVQARRQAVVEMAEGKYTYWSTVETFNPWNHLEAFGRFTREKDPGLRELARGIFNQVLEKLEDATETDLESARDAISDEFIATASEFPEQQMQLTWLREELYAAPGWGAQFANRPARTGDAGN